MRLNVSRFSNLGESSVFVIFFSAVFTSESSPAIEKFPGSMQIQRSRVSGKVRLVLVAVWGKG